MGVGPGVPVEGEGVTSLGVDESALGRGGALVAGNVGGAELGGLDEAEILVQRVPARGLGALTSRVVEPDGVRALEPGTVVDLDVGDEAVGRDHLGDIGHKAEEGGESLHLVWILTSLESVLGEDERIADEEKGRPKLNEELDGPTYRRICRACFVTSCEEDAPKAEAHTHTRLNGQAPWRRLRAKNDDFPRTRSSKEECMK